MILPLLILISLIGGVLAWSSEKWSVSAVRWISLWALGIDFSLSVYLFFSRGSGLTQIDVGWIPQWGIRFHLGLDGLSSVLVILTTFLGMISVLASWGEGGGGIRSRVGFFHFNLLWVLSGIMGVFMALDLFLFYFFWELMLLPMFLLIGIWGYENKTYAAMKFFIFTQASGLMMLVSILGLYFFHGRVTGDYTFDYFRLTGTQIPPSLEMGLMLGFLAAFAVKLPMIPFHTWLPDAHSEAPTAGSIILAGLLLKTGGYGMIRFLLPLFPNASARIAPVGMALAVAGILYGSVLAFSQKDLKRLIAYTSVSHLGFVLLGVFTGTELALQGAVIQMLSHGISTGALFFVAGAIQDRIHTRDLEQMGGLFGVATRISSTGIFFCVASLGLPGLGNFIGEFLVLLGTFQVSPVFGSLASAGFIFSTVYSLSLIQSVFHGPRPVQSTVQIFPDFSFQETLVASFLMVTLLGLGLYPQFILDAAHLPLLEIQHVYR